MTVNNVGTFANGRIAQDGVPGAFVGDFHDVGKGGELVRARVEVMGMAPGMLVTQ